MKTDIVLAGVGGQGILSIAAVVGFAAIEHNLCIKQAEVHGMSQRGGDVQSHLRISDKPIASDLISIGGADMILSVEPMEALRYLPYLSPNGWVISNTTPFINIENYPDEDTLMAEFEKLNRKVVLNADAIAKEVGAPKSSNIVVLGAASLHLRLPYESLENGIQKLFGKKSEELVEANLKALRAGRVFAEQAKK